MVAPVFFKDLIDESKHSEQGISPKLYVPFDDFSLKIMGKAVRVSSNTAHSANIIHYDCCVVDFVILRKVVAPVEGTDG